jgi:ABC-type multidrug transport system fused ATPase/permease subunit
MRDRRRRVRKKSLKAVRSKLYHQAIVLLPSALPCLLAVNLVMLLLLLVSWYNPTNTGLFLNSAINNSILFLSILAVCEILIIVFGWLYDMYVESVLGGYYTAKVRKNLRHGFYAFVISEAMLFFSFF